MRNRSSERGRPSSKKGSRMRRSSRSPSRDSKRRRSSRTSQKSSSRPSRRRDSSRSPPRRKGSYYVDDSPRRRKKGSPSPVRRRSPSPRRFSSSPRRRGRGSPRRSRTPPSPRGRRSPRRSRSPWSSRGRRSPARKSRSRSPVPTSSPSGSSSFPATPVDTAIDKVLPNPNLVQQMIAKQMHTANPQLTRLARRLYVGNLPIGIGLNESIITEFFNATVKSVGIKTPNPVLSSWLSSEGTFCFVEFRSVQDCTLCLTLLEGLQLGGRQLRFGRPADYKAPPPHLADYVVGGPLIPSQTTDSPKATPTTTTTTTAAETTATTAVAIPDAASVRESVAAAAAAAAAVAAPFANGTAKLNVAGLTSLTSLASGLAVSGLTVPGLGSRPVLPTNPPSRVIVMINMLENEDLSNDEEYADILEDIKLECEKFGTVNQVVIPRSGHEPGDIGVGKVFVEFDDVSAATDAQKRLHGRKFSDNEVVVGFYCELKLKDKIY